VVRRTSLEYQCTQRSTPFQSSLNWPYEIRSHIAFGDKLDSGKCIIFCGITKPHAGCVDVSQLSASQSLWSKSTAVSVGAWSQSRIIPGSDPNMDTCRLQAWFRNAITLLICPKSTVTRVSLARSQEVYGCVRSRAGHIRTHKHHSRPNVQIRNELLHSTVWTRPCGVLLGWHTWFISERHRILISAMDLAVLTR
jgi:hypothetical protein